MAEFIEGLSGVVHSFAEIVIYILELIGILVIVIGAIKAIYYLVANYFSHKKENIKIGLGNSLALGLEFKMGAEIIKTVIVRDLSELAILGAIILLRAILAVLIHWEIKTERKDELEIKNEKESESSKEETVKVENN